MAALQDPLIFISYRRADAGWAADLLASRLATTFGDRHVFLDHQGIHAGDDFAAELDDRLHRMSALVVLIGSEWLRAADKYGRRRLDLEDDWVRREIRLALENTDCRVIPVLLDDAELPPEVDALPHELAPLLKKQRRQLRQSSSNDDVEALIRELEEVGFRRPDHASTDASATRELTDEVVNAVVRRLGKLRDQSGTELLSLRQLLPELDLLFERKTFRFEALRRCPDQRWADRLDSAHQTLGVLKEYMPGVRKTAPRKYPVYRDLVGAVDAYCMQMGALLFNPPVDYNTIKGHIGKPTFKAQLPEEIKFPKTSDGQPVISDAINNMIECHRCHAIKLVDQLQGRPPVPCPECPETAPQARR